MFPLSSYCNGGRWHFVTLFWLLLSLIQLRPLSYDVKICTTSLLSIVREHPSIKLITNPETCFSQLFDKLLFIYGKSHFNCQIHNPQDTHRIYTH